MKSEFKEGIPDNLGDMKRVIGDRLGIDLLSYVKIVYYKKVWVIEDNRVRRLYVKDIDMVNRKINGYINVGANGCACYEYSCDLDGMGKTWAFTKEELSIILDAKKIGVDFVGCPL